MRKWLLGLMFLAGLLAACGGTGTTNTVDTEKTASALDNAFTQLYRVMEPLSQAGIFLPTFLSAGVAPLDTATWDCSSVRVIGNTTDADGDGIPVNATYNGGCTWSYSGGGGTVSGRWEFSNVNVQDPNDADPDAGLKASGTITWTVSSAGTTYTFTWNLSKHEITRTENTWNFTYQGSWEATVGGDTYTFNYDLSGTWTPDNADDLWGNGSLSVTGDFSGSGPSCSGWSLSISASVHLSTCGVDSGTASLSGTDCDGKTCNLDITWAGCDNASVSGGCN